MNRVNRIVLLSLLACTACATDSPQAPDAADRQQQLTELREEFFAYADSPEVSKEGRVRIKLYETLFRFAEEQSLSSYELSSLLGERALDAPLWDKGGVGTLGHPLYVVLVGKRNAVLLGEDHEWEGKPSDEAEIVLVSKDRQIVDESSFDYNDGIIIFFAPDEVRFVDFSTNTGGRYKRLRDSGDIK